MDLKTCLLLHDCSLQYFAHLEINVVCAPVMCMSPMSRVHLFEINLSMEESDIVIPTNGC